MQFVVKGPDIPDALLQAHEDGRVVFFCGAGISYPAGLPGFEDLVNKIYELNSTTPEPMEQQPYSRKQFDATLDLLERRVPGQRAKVRGALAAALQPKLRRKGATDTHRALLQLARSRAGELRLVTTNFDRIFEWVVKHNNQSVTTYAAPALPVPKNSRWNGLVYLHGLLPDHDDPSALDRLVLTSGDFGLAYLTERWAARFVTELFRNYVVCFVGYSLNDPVLRYMMDALAADRMMGEVTPPAYAFGECTSGDEHNKTIEWEAKGVRPILYEVPTPRDHSALHQTIKAWAATYRDGVRGKERIAVEYAIARPSASTQQDDFVGRMLWALSDPSGLPAKQFAEFDPVPPLEWLEAFTADRYRHGDLPRFNVLPHAKVDDKLSFSLFRRPTPYGRAPLMSLVSERVMDSQWDDVMDHLAHWLVRHLSDPALILWLARQGGHLHDQLARRIEQELAHVSNLEREGKLDEPARTVVLLRPIWHLFLTGRVKSRWSDLDIYGWKDKIGREGLTPTLRFQLRKLLAPKVVLKEPFRWPGITRKTDAPACLKDLIDWEFVLAAHDVHSCLRDLAKDENWSAALPALLDDLQHLLRDALDLQRELGEADYLRDRSYRDLPSISPHWQNRGFRDWVVLIELLRDAWLATREVDSDRASQVAKAWFAMPYFTFKRLALFAASQDDCITPDEWVGWLLTEDTSWLWSDETKRETLRLLVLQGRCPTAQARERLESAILSGPPCTGYWSDPEFRGKFADHFVWLRLAKLQSSGAALGAAAADRLASLSAAHPAWQLAENERDEFSSWMSVTDDPEFEDSRSIDRAPRKHLELVEWLRRLTQSDPPYFNGDTWGKTCRARPLHCGLALCHLAHEGSWPSWSWTEAFHAWSQGKRASRSWRFIAPVVHTMPDEVLKEIANSVTWWLEAVSKSVDRHEHIFLDLCRRILALPHSEGVDTDSLVDSAINHPVGHVTQALLNLWFERKPNDNDRLPADLEPFFTQLCNRGLPQFRHARVLLASEVIALFRVDRSWTEAHLLPLFDWTIDAVEARTAWQGFVWSPRLYRPLLIAFKAQFLDTAKHYTELGEDAQQFAAFLTYAALDSVDGYTAQDFQTAFRALPQQGLEKVARSLVQALQAAGEQREDYWANRIQPLWQHVWPKSRQLASQSIKESLARLSIAARNKFPAALATVLDWIRPIEHPNSVVEFLHKSALSSRFPEHALCLLDAIIIDNQPWPPVKLRECLEAIAQAAPALLQDRHYQRLDEYCRKNNT